VSDIKGIDYKFFLSHQSREPLPDEVFLDVPDNYSSLPLKVRAMCRWALQNGFSDGLLKADDDVIVYPDRLLANLPEQDYTGFINQAVVPYCSGFTYWLSAPATKIISETDISEDQAEDRWVGTTLAKHNIRPFYDKRFCYFKPPTWQITCSPESIIAICDCSKI
jgi:hypothetical protein